MQPKAKVLARTGPGRDNLSGFSRGDDNALSHRDKSVINKLYNCAGKCNLGFTKGSKQVIKHIPKLEYIIDENSIRFLCHFGV